MERRPSPPPSDDSREFRAFLATPFVATALWCGAMFLTLAAIDGVAAAVRDIPTLLVGALIGGLPVAALVTVLLAGPAYAFHAVRGSITRRTAFLNGALVGAVTLFLVGGFPRDLRYVGAVVGAGIGLVCAEVWWRIARAGDPHHGPSVGAR